ncbi:MAG: helix-turn-helix domain-containing protein [Pseudobdellovibrio sp.]
MTKKFNIPKDVSSLGEAVKAAREAQGITLRGLAEKVGVSAPFLSDVERGRRQTEKIDILAKSLNVDVAELAKFDTRVTPELRDWLGENPKLVSALKQMQSAGTSFNAEAFNSILKNKLK